MGYVSEAVQVVQRPGNYVDISLWGMKRIMKYIRPRSQPPSSLVFVCFVLYFSLCKSSYKI